MQSTRRVLLSIVGARPQFVKLAPIVRAIEAQSGPGSTLIRHVVVHTGQHYDEAMSDVFFRDLALPKPDHHLEVGSASHATQTARMLERLEPVLLEEKPDWTIVYGDTNSTLAGALAAAKLHLRVAHIEAGLRSFNREMPEETNRVVADHLSDLLFCPTAAAVDNLAREGITRGVHQVGDVMADAVLQHAEIARRRSSALAELGLKRREYALATIHRAENTDDPGRLSALLAALDEIAVGRMPVLLPLHPRTRKALDALALKPRSRRLRLVPPASYLDMLALESEARLILTDSGGVQKEAFLLAVPCLTLREETEWVETVASGWNLLVGADQARIVDGACRLLSEPPSPFGVPPYGDGHAAERIVGVLLDA